MSTVKLGPRKNRPKFEVKMVTSDYSWNVQTWRCFGNLKRYYGNQKLFCKSSGFFTIGAINTVYKGWRDLHVAFQAYNRHYQSSCGMENSDIL